MNEPATVATPGAVHPDDLASAASGSAWFAAGTQVLSLRGWTPVERLTVQDRLIAGSGARRRLGRVQRAPAPADAPVRIRAGAFSADLPRHDLLLSAGSAIRIEDGLVPAAGLVNGATVLWAPGGADGLDGSWYRLSLDAAEPILAEGVPVWSGGASPPEPAGLLRRVRAHLLGRADRLGYRMTQEAGLHLRVDGRRIWGMIRDGIWSGWIPQQARCVELVSRSGAPADCLLDSTDHRRLGVALRRVVVHGAGGAQRLEPEGTGWAAGFHAMEENCWGRWRWTDGCGRLDPCLWAGSLSALRLDLHVHATATYRLDEGEIDTLAGRAPALLSPG